LSGTYDVQIRDTNHPTCVIDLTTLTYPVILSASVVKPRNAASDGTITVSAPTGGYGTYEYRLGNGVAVQRKLHWLVLLLLIAYKSEIYLYCLRYRFR
jgi:hypothetical protein